ncbi:MAG: hypothetical protein V1750_00005, partial [Acidobacteriota bacterium]
LALDLRDLAVRPGFLPIDGIEIAAERGAGAGAWSPVALVKTDPHVTPVTAPIVSPLAATETLTGEPVQDLRRATCKGEGARPATEGEMAGTPPRRRGSGEGED